MNTTAALKTATIAAEDVRRGQRVLSIARPGQSLIEFEKPTRVLNAFNDRGFSYLLLLGPAAGTSEIFDRLALDCEVTILSED